MLLHHHYQALRKDLDLFFTKNSFFLFFSTTTANTLSPLKNINQDGKQHRTPTSDLIKVIVPTKAVARWVSL
jgi:hypothetical protein